MSGELAGAFHMFLPRSHPRPPLSRVMITGAVISRSRHIGRTIKRSPFMRTRVRTDGTSLPESAAQRNPFQKWASNAHGGNSSGNQRDSNSRAFGFAGRGLHNERSPWHPPGFQRAVSNCADGPTGPSRSLSVPQSPFLLRRRRYIHHDNCLKAFRFCLINGGPPSDLATSKPRCVQPHIWIACLSTYGRLLWSSRPRILPISVPLVQTA